MKNFRDIEQISSYLDGQLSLSESAQLESRLTSDPELGSVLKEMRAARGLLRKMPARRAPRNFTLTRKMVGLKPPLPQSYSFFRLSTAIASVLLVLTFAANSLPRIGMGGAAAPVQSFATCNACGGGGSDTTGAPAATEAPAIQAPSMELVPAPTQAEPGASADSTRIGEAPTAEAQLQKEPEPESAPQDQSRVGAEALIPLTWQIILLVIGLGSAGIAFAIHQNARKKWS
ncbi:MAG: hypothetical protein K8S20_08965 [Chloroflexi bacterium]|nr:hypothetical protein [Chloroflexota bacterium]